MPLKQLKKTDLSKKPGRQASLRLIEPRDE
jgi:hypothetical protein